MSKKKPKPKKKPQSKPKPKPKKGRVLLNDILKSKKESGEAFK